MSFMKLLGSLGNFGKIQQEMQAIQAEIAGLSFEGKAGGDMVTVSVTGTQQISNIAIDPSLLVNPDKEMIEELVTSAANIALAQSRRQSAEILQSRLQERLNLPAIPGLLDSLIPKG